MICIDKCSGAYVRSGVGVVVVVVFGGIAYFVDWMSSNVIARSFAHSVSRRLDVAIHVRHVTAIIVAGERERLNLLAFEQCLIILSTLQKHKQNHGSTTMKLTKLNYG